MNLIITTLFHIEIYFPISDAINIFIIVISGHTKNVPLFDGSDFIFSRDLWVTFGTSQTYRCWKRLRRGKGCTTFECPQRIADVAMSHCYVIVIVPYRKSLLFHLCVWHFALFLALPIWTDLLVWSWSTSHFFGF